MSAAAPTSRGSLHVFLHGELLGELSDRTVGFVAFDFDEEAILRHGAGSRVLSLALPMSWETVDPFVATAFFAGLLPEGAARQRLSEEFRISPDDPYGLLAVLGRESAGALVIVPSGETPPGVSHAAVEPLAPEQLVRHLERLAAFPLGVTVDDDEIRLSLAGVQDKLPLVRLEDGTIALPRQGHPSTHIAKPSRGQERFPDLVENEAFCLTVAAALEIPTTAFKVLLVAGEPVLLVERYDRVRDEDGTVHRVHQEDACQATAINPAFKYEASGGPSLARVADLVADHSTQPGIDRITLFRLTVCNALLGNCDAHGKNIAFLHASDGIRLAPAYDIVSTQAYQHTDVLGMRIGGVDRLRDVTRDALLAQAVELGLGTTLGDRLLVEFAERFPPSLEVAQALAEEEGWAAAITERIASASRERAEQILA